MLLNNQNSSDAFLFSFGRKYILLFGWICSFTIITVIWLWASVNPLWISLWCAFGMIALNIHTKSQRKYFAPFFMTILYFFGYLLALIYVVIHKNSFHLNDRYAYILLEDLKSKDMLRLTLVLAAGLAGIICTTFVSEYFSKRTGNFSSLQIPGKNKNVSNNKTYILICSWLVGSVLLLLCMWLLRIGRGGLSNQTILPFKLAGIMVYSRSFLIPFIGIVFLEINLNHGRTKQVWFILYSIIFIGLLGSITAMSRSYFFYATIPPITYLILKEWRNNQNQRILALSLLLCVIASVIMVSFVHNLRTTGFTGDTLSLSKLNVHDSESAIAEGATKLVTLAVTRTIGLQELLRVYDASIHDISAPIAVFWGSDKQYLNFLLLQVTGRKFESSDGTTSFGYGFGLWGGWFMSGSYILVFLASFVFSLLIVFVENIFLRKGFQICTIYLSLTLSMWTWGGIYLFFLKRAIFMIIVCYFVMIKLQKWSNPNPETIYPNVQ